MSEDKNMPAKKLRKGKVDGTSASSGSDVQAFLDKVSSLTPHTKNKSRGRLIFAMDATMSRQPTWDLALGTQADMFREVKSIGGLDVQLVYFRGFRECAASKWVDDPETLADLMTGVQCRGGHTQIRKVLLHARRETEKERVGAMVYVGDCMEENLDDLAEQAGVLGLLGVRGFLLKEGGDHKAETAFRELARLTHGAYCRFDAGSANQLRDLLSAVAVYAAGGHKALVDLSRSKGESVKALLEQLE